MESAVNVLHTIYAQASFLPVFSARQPKQNMTAVLMHCYMTGEKFKK